MNKYYEGKESDCGNYPSQPSGGKSAEEILKKYVMQDPDMDGQYMYEDWTKQKSYSLVIAAMEEYASQYAHQHPVNDGWVRVDDALPGYLTRCLVTNGEYVKLAWSKDDDEHWCEIQSSDYDVWLSDVTHWRPLPEPPKQTP